MHIINAILHHPAFFVLCIAVAIFSVLFVGYRLADLLDRERDL